MLRASSSGIVLLKQCLSESQTRAPHRRVVYHALQCYCLFHTHAPANSRFSTRFGSPLSTLINQPVEAGDAEGEGTREGDQREELLPPGLGLDALGELDGKSIRKRVKYYYLPWARPAPPRTSTRRVGQREGAAGVNGRSTRAGRKKRAIGKRIANASPERHSRVRTATTRRRKLGKVDNAEKTKEQVIASEVEGDAVENAILDRVESSASHQVSDKEVKAPESSIDSYEFHSEEVIHVEDLSAKQLQAIILDRNSDLMGLAWDAYQRLITLDTEFHYHTLSDSDSQQGAASSNLVNPNLLITLANRLIAQRKHHHKHSREIFLRLISVYARLRKERARGGGVPYLRTPEWNCLIHFAGTGLRGKMSLEAYNASLDVYDDMLRGVEDARSAGRGSLLKQVEPDIYTYTSLLNIALRTEHQPAIEHAMKLLRESGKEPTRITHLCMIRYRYKYGGLIGVRALLSSLKPEDIGVDGVTAYMACAGNDGYLDVVRNIYDALRRNVEAHEDGTYGLLANHTQYTEGSDSFETPVVNDENNGIESEKYMLVEGIRLPRSLVPSAEIYNYTIQIFAYYGRLIDALQVFMDMLATRQPNPRGPVKFFQPNFAVFRGLFLGFARHGCRTDPKSSSSSPSTTLSTPLTEISQIPEWNWDRFNVILDAFIEHGDSIRPPSERMVYWIMTAVRRMTGDERLMRDVWRRLNERWYIRKGGRLKALDLKYGRTK
ncbi:hypothetical protein ACEPAG_6582 [Sanghuangporus baumii]